jgi:hypothetical protein
MTSDTVLKWVGLRGLHSLRSPRGAASIAYALRSLASGGRSHPGRLLGRNGLAVRGYADGEV